MNIITDAIQLVNEFEQWLDDEGNPIGASTGENAKAASSLLSFLNERTQNDDLTDTDHGN